MSEIWERKGEKKERKEKEKEKGKRKKRIKRKVDELLLQISGIPTEETCRTNK